MSRSLALAALLLAAGCGRGTFAPDCPLPPKGARAEPAALVALADGGVAAIHADSREQWCGGFVSWHAPDGSEFRAPTVAATPDGYEANFVGAAGTRNRIWMVGRRYGTLIGIGRTSGDVEIVKRGLDAERIAAVDDNRFVVWIGGSRGTLIVFNDGGNELASIAVDAAVLGATAHDPATDTLYVAYDGGAAIRTVDLARSAAGRLHYPLGLGPSYRQRGLALTAEGLFASDVARGIVVRWDPASGDVLDAEPVGRNPEPLALGPDGRLWAADAVGAVFLRQDGRWQAQAAGFGRPVALAAVTEAVWVADFADEPITRVDAP